MKIRTFAYLITLSFAVCACDEETTTTVRPEEQDNGTPQVQPSAGEPESKSEPAVGAPRRKPVGLCAVIDSEDVSKITGQAYDMALSAAAYPDLSHCEYRQNRHSVSLMLASGETATAQMDQAKAGPVEAITGFEDAAVWDGAQGKLTAVSGERCIEVVVSPEHGDAGTRLGQAKALATLALSRSPAAAPAPAEPQPQQQPAPEPPPSGATTPAAEGQ